MSRQTAMALCLIVCSNTLGSVHGRTDAPPRVHVRMSDVKWDTGSTYPPTLRAVVRWKDLVGGTGGGVVAQPDVFMGVLELAPGAFYPAHQHASPEMYYVTSGTGEWTVEDETFRAAPGTAIYHPPNTLHRMVNKGNDVLRAVYVWWAPGGDRRVFDGPIDLLEAVPQQPPQAKFEEP